MGQTLLLTMRRHSKIVERTERRMENGKVKSSENTCICEPQDT